MKTKCIDGRKTKNVKFKEKKLRFVVDLSLSFLDQLSQDELMDVYQGLCSRIRVGGEDTRRDPKKAFVAKSARVEVAGKGRVE